MEEFSKHVGKDATIVVISDFRLCVQSDLSVELMASRGCDLCLLANFQVANNIDVILFSALESERISILSFFELERQYSHTD